MFLHSEILTRADFIVWTSIISSLSSSNVTVDIDFRISNYTYLITVCVMVSADSSQKIALTSPIKSFLSFFKLFR